MWRFGFFDCCTFSDSARSVEQLTSCSNLLVRFYPASEAWNFLRELRIAGYCRRASDDIFHINFAIFNWQKDSSNVPSMGMPLFTSTDESYGIEMLWSLGYLFQDKYNADSQFLMRTRDKSFYDLCCIIWRNLKLNHCYQFRDALNDQTANQKRENSNESSQLKEVAFAIITPHRIEYQPWHMTHCHRGFNLHPYSPENWLLVHFRDANGIDKINNLDLQTRVRLRNYMINGISRGGRLFKYFGSSGSQMNDQAGWFLSLSDETMDSARKKIGDLSKIHNVSILILHELVYI